MKLQKETENKFIELLWQMPKHWFADEVNGIKVMAPISIALRQTVEIKLGYSFDEDEPMDKQMLEVYKREKEIYEQTVSKILELPNEIQNRLRIYYKQ